MMTPVDDFLATMGGPPPTHDDAFLRLAQRTALRCTADGQYYLSNLRRGHLLYTLVARLRPRVVLEIGTGRGYGALCMAMAAVDEGIDTTIITVDRIPPDTQQDWPIDEGTGPATLRRSLRQVWRSLPDEWTSRVETRTGYSTDVMRDWLAESRNPPVDFAFVDGGHDFWIARHDIMSAVLAGRGKSVSLLLDDYGGVQGEAVRQLVDRRLAPRLAATAVHRLAMSQSPEEFSDNGEHGMVFIDGRVTAVTAEPLGWRSPAVTASVARMAARVEHNVWRARSAAARQLRHLRPR